MRKQLAIVLFILFCSIAAWTALLPTPLNAQPNSCGTTLQRIDNALESCKEINRNYVCYGNTEAEALPIKHRFHDVNDRRPFDVLDSVATQSEQGVVVMNLHIEGETIPVKAILFGPVTAEPVDPLQRSFLLRTAEDNPVCQSTPPGMVVRTESGQTGLVTVNGVEIELGSTAYVCYNACRAHDYHKYGRERNGYHQWGHLYYSGWSRGIDRSHQWCSSVYQRPEYLVKL